MLLRGAHVLPNRDIHHICILCIAGQLLRHYSPDLEVFRVVGVTAAGSDGRIGNNGEGDGLKEMARWVALRSGCLVKEVVAGWYAFGNR